MPLRDPQDRKPFATMLATVASLYGRDVTPELTAMYWRALAAYGIDDVRRAFDRHVKNPDAGQYFPKPADLIRMLEGSTQDAAAMAWARVERAMRTVGGYESVDFGDQITHECVTRMGGWIRLCESREDEIQFRFKDFVTMYRGFVARHEMPANSPKRLAGRFELDHARMGIEYTQVVRIGLENQEVKKLEPQG